MSSFSTNPFAKKMKFSKVNTPSPPLADMITGIIFCVDYGNE